MRKPYPSSIYCQSGAVLLVSLIMLVLLTVIGVAAVNTTILETKMAANLQGEVIAFNRAESTLRAGEDFIDATIIPQSPFPFSTTAGTFETALENIDPTPLTLGNIVWDANDSIQVLDPNDNTTIIGRYIIEYLGASDRPGEDLDSDLAGSKVHLFRVTARGIDNASGTEKVVRSLYATVNSPI